MREDRELIAAFGLAANDYSREAVIGAAANILMNALRQCHPRLGEASEELRDLHDRMQAALAKSHYYEDGSRNDRRIVLPPLMPLVRQLAAQS